MDRAAPDSFRVEVTFQDGVPATLCGFCRRGWNDWIEAQFSVLNLFAFGPWQEGRLIDRRLHRLITRVALPIEEGVLLLAASVRVPSADGPCGAVLGHPCTPPESAGEGWDQILLPDGRRLRLLLRPGIGGVAFFCEDGAREAALYTHTAACFPQEIALERLRREADGVLWALDYAADHPVLNGSCHALLKESYEVPR